MIDDCAAKIKADGKAEAKAYKECLEWGGNIAKNTNVARRQQSRKKNWNPPLTRIPVTWKLRLQRLKIWQVG